MLIGSHVSIQGGLHEAPSRAKRFGCECFQIFSRNQRQWTVPPLTQDAIHAFRNAWNENGHLLALIHDSYLVNIATPDDSLRTRSRNALADELKRADALRIPWVNIHPGSHRGAGEKIGLELCADSLKWILRKTGNLKAGISTVPM